MNYSGKNVSEVFLSVFEKLLYYVFGVKLVGIARSGVEYVKSKTDKKDEFKEELSKILPIDING